MFLRVLYKKPMPSYCPVALCQPSSTAIFFAPPFTSGPTAGNFFWAFERITTSVDTLRAVSLVNLQL